MTALVKCNRVNYATKCRREGKPTIHFPTRNEQNFHCHQAIKYLLRLTAAVYPYFSFNQYNYTTIGGEPVGIYFSWIIFFYQTPKRQFLVCAFPVPVSFHGFKTLPSFSLWLWTWSKNSLIHRANFAFSDTLIWYTPIEPFCQTPSIDYRFFLALLGRETKAGPEKPRA